MLHTSACFIPKHLLLWTRYRTHITRFLSTSPPAPVCIHTNAITPINSPKPCNWTYHASKLSMMPYEHHLTKLHQPQLDHPLDYYQVDGFLNMGPVPDPLPTEVWTKTQIYWQQWPPLWIGRLEQYLGYNPLQITLLTDLSQWSLPRAPVFSAVSFDGHNIQPP